MKRFFFFTLICVLSWSKFLYAQNFFNLYAHNSGWQDTGIYVSEDQEVTFSASGSVIHWKSQDQTRSIEIPESFEDVKKLE